MKRFVPFALVAAIALFPMLAAAAVPAAPASPTESTLNVPGDGVIQRAPDVARISISIVTNDDSATVSTSKNNDIYNKLQASLAPLGLSGAALKTTSFGVVFVPHPPQGLPPAQQQSRYGYITTRSLLATISDLSTVGKVIDASTAAGVTNVGGVSYDLKDRKSAYVAALAVAMLDAKQTAQAVATAGGFTLVRIHTVTVGTQYVPLMQIAAVRAGGGNSTPTDIQPGGPISVSAHVDVTYTIK